MKMKKTLFGAFLGMFALAGIAVLPNVASAQPENPDTNPNGGGGSYDSFGSDSEDHFGFGGQNKDYNPDVYGSNEFQKDSLIKTIQNTINWVLGILSLIALCLCLWGGFKMMTSGGDQKAYEGGLNLLKWAAIGLAVIALSWLVVSLIFYLINTNSATTSGGNSGKQTTETITQ